MVRELCLIGLLAAVCVADTGARTTATERQAADTDSGAQTDLLERFNGEFVAITPGQGQFPATYVMGTGYGPWCEEPAHKVTLTAKFQMARYEVPQNLYEAVMGHNPSQWKGPRNSVEKVAFADVVEFCRKATVQMRARRLIAQTEEIRLPSEAEWEYCCRAGTTTPYSFGESATGPKDTGNGASLLDSYAWHTGNAAGNDPPVGAKQPNPWGLYDMHGYLWEFVSDGWHETYAGAPSDGSSWAGSEPNARRVIRGGSWKERYECHRSGFRMPIAADGKSDAIGFRCVKASVPK